MLTKKAVIPAAGLGTRLLSATKEQPKEMLPIFARTSNGTLGMKPLLQMVFEQLHGVGFREYCFVVGRGKRSIEDHFTRDTGFISQLNLKGKYEIASDLQDFYKRLDESIIIWVNQPEPRGFGHSVLLSKSFTPTGTFFVHAGDTLIRSKGAEHIKRLSTAHFEEKADATLMLQEVDDPREYGVAEVENAEKGRVTVKRVEEKPDHPKTNLALMPLYIFEPSIFRALEATPPGKSGEIQLTDGIQKMIDWGMKVCSIILRESEVRLDIGTPETYWQALSTSYNSL